MSSSSDTNRGTGRLIAEGPDGVEISIVNGSFETLATGTLRLELELPEGIYTVRWSGAGRIEQEVVRLRAIAKPLHVARQDFACRSAVPESVGCDRELEVSQVAAASQIASRVDSDVGPDEAEIVIFVRADDRRTQSRVSKDIRVLTRDPSSGRFERNEPCERGSTHDAEAGWASDRYVLKSGMHVLCYETSARRRVEQSIYAPPGRKTVAFLKYGQSLITQGSGDGTLLRRRRGIDPAHSTILSRPLGDKDDFFADARTADILLHQLESHRAHIDEGLLQKLARPDTDPYLQLYALAVHVARAGRTADRLASVAADPAERELSAAERELGMMLLDALSPHAQWTDARCVAWRLGIPGLSEASNAPLNIPPMLECCWRWAAAYSVQRPDHPIADPYALGAAKRADPSHAPWLVWAANPSPEEIKIEERSSEKLREGITHLAMGLGRVATSGWDTIKAAKTRMETAAGSPSIGLGGLSVDTRQLAETLLGTGQASSWENPTPQLLEQFASSTGTPLHELVPKIELAVAEVAELAADSGGADDDTNLLTSDPNKGRFGKLAQRKDLRLSLDSIETSNHKDVLALTISVAPVRPGRTLDGTVTFFLHPTFNPDHEMVRVRDNRAVFTCYAWGAFTLGAQTSDGISLELDLAEDERLPRWFRDR
jgi:hypothetical protein